MTSRFKVGETYVIKKMIDGYYSHFNVLRVNKKSVLLKFYSLSDDWSMTLRCPHDDVDLFDYKLDVKNRLKKILK